MEDLVREIVARYKKDPQTLAVFLPGSTAKGREGSDIDIGVITEDENRFEHFWEDGVLVEISMFTLVEARRKLKEDPMFIYFLLDARALWDPENLLVQLKNEAKQAYKEYKMGDAEFEKLIYWLTSLKLKIQKAQNSGDSKKASFYATTGLWKILEGFFALSSIPMLPAASVLPNLDKLEVKPRNFGKLLDEILSGNVQERQNAALSLIDFFLEKAK